MLSVWAAPILVLSILFLPAASIGAVVVANGDFESGSTVVQAGAGGVNSSGNVASSIMGSLSGWDVSNGAFDVIATNSQTYLSLNSNPSWVASAPVGAIPGPHQNGVANQNGLVAAFVSFPSYNGYISQPIQGVVSGQQYHISFWLSNQIESGSFPNNSMSAYFGGTIALDGSLNLTNASTLLSPTPIAVPTGWVKYEYDVTAPANNARLSFQGGNTNSAVLLDDVTVVETPEPSALVMLGIGAALAGMRRNRRQRA